MIPAWILDKEERSSNLIPNLAYVKLSRVRSELIVLIYTIS
jgi:hypothetical protein